MKKTIRTHKSKSEEKCGNPTCSAEIIIAENAMFANPNFLSLLTGSETWYADGTFKVLPEYFFQLYTIHAERDGFVYPCEYALLPDKLVLLTIDFSLISSSKYNHN